MGESVKGLLARLCTTGTSTLGLIAVFDDMEPADVKPAGWQLVCRRPALAQCRNIAPAGKLPPCGLSRERWLNLAENRCTHSLVVREQDRGRVTPPEEESSGDKGP